MRGLRILDLGCGDAAIGRRLLEAGCRSYPGIDASARMIEAARDALRGTAGEVRAAELARRRRIPLFLLLSGDC